MPEQTFSQILEQKYRDKRTREKIKAAQQKTVNRAKNKAARKARRINRK